MTGPSPKPKLHHFGGPVFRFLSLPILIPVKPYGVVGCLLVPIYAFIRSPTLHSLVYVPNHLLCSDCYAPVGGRRARVQPTPVDGGQISCGLSSELSWSPSLCDAFDWFQQGPKQSWSLVGLISLSLLQQKVMQQRVNIPVCHRITVAIQGVSAIHQCPVSSGQSARWDLLMTYLYIQLSYSAHCTQHSHFNWWNYLLYVFYEHQRWRV